MRVFPSAPTGRVGGVSKPRLRGRAWHKPANRLDDRTRALCEVADKLSATPTRFVEDDWGPLRALGFDDHACLEVAHVVGMFNHLTRLADGFGLALDSETSNASQTQTPLTSRKGG